MLRFLIKPYYAWLRRDSHGGDAFCDAKKRQGSVRSGGSSIGGPGRGLTPGLKTKFGSIFFAFHPVTKDFLDEEEDVSFCVEVGEEVGITNA